MILYSAIRTLIIDQCINSFFNGIYKLIPNKTNQYPCQRCGYSRPKIFLNANNRFCVECPNCEANIDTNTRTIEEFMIQWKGVEGYMNQLFALSGLPQAIGNSGKILGS